MRLYNSIIDRQLRGGVLVLNQSLQNVHSVYPLYCLCAESVNSEIVDVLEKNDIKVIIKPAIDISTISGKEMSGWDYTYFKFYIFSLIQFDKMIYLDADMMILKNIDHLFEKEGFAICKDDFQFTKEKISTSKCNSGIIVFSPSMKLFDNLLETLPSAISEGMMGDQEVLNLFIDDSVEWLSAKYNMSSNMVERSVLLDNYFDFRVRDICVVHFAFRSSKPFLENLLRPNRFFRKLVKLHFIEIYYILRYYEIASSLEDKKVFWKYVR